MKSLTDPKRALSAGLAKIRSQFKVPEAFPPAARAAAEAAAKRDPNPHVDRTSLPFVTLDPASSTDLDQAFAIEHAGRDVLLRYAIADVPWFVRDDDAIDDEAWNRGETLYLPDGRAGLYPPVLSENAASLLPDGPRPAVIFAIRVAEDGAVKLDGAERAVIRSRAKLAYETVRESELPSGFSEIARRMGSAEERRGASRVDPPEQEVERGADGSFQLRFRRPLWSEEQNAALSLACNMAVADAMFAHRTGLFRVMVDPDEAAVARLRNTAKALGIAWPGTVGLREFQKTLDPADPAQSMMMLAIRRAGQGASYMPYREGVTPWHSAMSATYAHATAPLRRLADRYVIRAVLAIANGEAVPQSLSEAFERLPKVMARADGHAAQISRAVVDLAEAVMLAGHEGKTFAAVVTDINDRGVRVQVADLPVVANVGTNGLRPGDRLRVKLVSADPAQRALRFERVE